MTQPNLTPFEPATTANPANDGQRYLESLYAEPRQAYTFHHDYPGGFNSWSAEARPVLRQLLGLDNMAQDTADHQPSVRLGEPEDRDDYSLQLGYIETEPNIHLPFWLLRPQGQPGPIPLAILPHGHDRQGHNSYAGVYQDESHRQQSLAMDRDVAVQAVRHGFLAIAPATRGLSLAANYVPDTFDRHGNRDCRSYLIHAILAGRTAVGERVWDMMRLIDWASDLPEVTTETLLMMGNSGGGVVTMYTAACDQRIVMAVPSCSFSVIANPQGRIYHCDCCAVPGILRWGQLYDVCGLIAPRRLLVVNGIKDQLHSETEIARSAERVDTIFDAAGVPDHFQHRWGSEGHRFYSELMWPIIMSAI